MDVKQKVIRLCNFITALRLVFRNYFNILNTRKTGQHHFSYATQIRIPTRTSTFSISDMSFFLDAFTNLSSLNRFMPLFLPMHTCLAIRVRESRNATTRISVHCITTRPAILAWFALTLIYICNKTHLFQTRHFKIMQQSRVKNKIYGTKHWKCIENSIPSRS